MTWPSGATSTTNLDAGTDSPSSARADLLDGTQKLNQIIAHVSSFIQGLLDDANAAAAQATLGLGPLATKTTIATADIDNDAATYAKIQNVSATDRLLGRAAAGAGDVEEIVCTAAGRALIDDADYLAQRATLGIIVKRKTADESVTSSTIVQDDDHLTFPIGANEEWVVEWQLDLANTSALTAHGSNFQVNTPAGSTVDVWIEDEGNVLIAAQGNRNTKTINTTLNYGTAAYASSGPGGFHIRAWVLNGATPGDVKLQWAQGTSSGTAMTIRKGSFMKAHRVA